MIVVLIIGILMAIAVPNFIQARQTSRMNSCIANLKQIDSATEQYQRLPGLLSLLRCQPQLVGEMVALENLVDLRLPTLVVAVESNGRLDLRTARR